MKIQELIIQESKHLKEKGIEDYYIKAEILMEYTLNKTKQEIIINRK